MAVVVTLEQTALDVTPGGMTNCAVTIRNTGTIVDQFEFAVVGIDPEWATFEPATVSLMPGSEGTTQLLLRAPRSPRTRAGTVPFGVKATSLEDAGTTVVEEGTVTVAAFHEPVAELVPRTSHGRRSALHQLSVDNRGNTPLNATVRAQDPDELVDFVVTPPAVVTEPGSATLVQVSAQPRRTFLRGPSRTLPFQVLIEAAGSPPVAVDGSMVQEAIIPRWAPRAAAAVLAGLVGLAVIWVAVLRPTVKSSAKEAAREAVEEPLAQVSAQVGALDERTSALAEAVTGSVPEPVVTTTTTSPGGGGDGDGGDGDGGGAGGGAFGVPVAGRLQINGGASSATFTAPDDQVVSITDLLFQNPAGDAGVLRLQRGTADFLELQLGNFRDLDYHFVAPVVLTAGESLTIRVQCQRTDQQACSPALTFSGFSRPE